MKKKVYTHLSSGYDSWGIIRTLREAENIARWNPWIAHAWMEEARQEISLDKPFFNEFDAAVDRINAHWILLQKFHWFDEAAFWEYNGEPNSMELIDKISDL